jgi:hypothetical protein
LAPRPKGEGRAASLEKEAGCSREQAKPQVEKKAAAVERAFVP